MQVCCFLSVDSAFVSLPLHFPPSVAKIFTRCDLMLVDAHAVFDHMYDLTSKSTLLEIQLDITELFFSLFLSVYLEHITHMNHCLPLEVMSKC